jgi:Flp pilus assembly protein TadD
MECKRVQRELVPFLLGETSRRASLRVASHLHSCRDCLEDLQSLHLTTAMMRLSPRARLSSAFDAKLAHRLQPVAGLPVRGPSFLRREGFTIGLVAAAAAAVWMFVLVTRAPVIGPAPIRRAPVVATATTDARTNPQATTRPGRARVSAGTRQESGGSLISVSRPTTSIGKLLRVVGAPHVQATGTEGLVVCRQGEEAPAGEFSTGATDRLEVELADGSRVGLDFDTTVEVAQAPAAAGQTPRARLRLSAGRVWLLVTPAQKGLVVETPTAQAEALGTMFSVQVEPGVGTAGDAAAKLGHTELVVLRGKVRFWNDRGEVMVADGRQADAVVAAGPTSPTPVKYLQTMRYQAPWGGSSFEVWVADRLKPDTALPGLAEASGADGPLAEGNRAFAQGDISEAIRRYQQSLAAGGEEAASLNNIGIGYEVQGQLEGAVETYRKAVALAPDVSLYHRNLGMALYRVGNLRRAAAELEVAVASGPSVAETRYTLGMIYAFLADQGRAMQQSEALQSDAATAAQGYCVMGEILRVEGKRHEAAPWYRKAIASKPDYVAPLVYLAAVHYSDNNLDEAVTVLERALALEPTSVRALSRLGMVFLRQGKLDEARTVMLKATAVGPELGSVRNNLALVCLKQGDLAGARSEYQEAVRLSPLLVECHIGLGVALERGGHAEEAKAAYAEAASLDPTYGDAYLRLADLQQKLGESRSAANTLARGKQYGL